FLLGGLFLNASFVVGAPPDGGWFGYTSLTLRQFSPGLNIDFWVIGLQILGVSSVMAGVNFITTILNMRAPGLTLMRMPVFVWMCPTPIAVPTAVKIFNWLATLWRGSFRPSVAFHYAAGLVALFTLGGLSGVMHSSPPVDLQQTDSYFVVAHFHYVLIGGSLFGLLAGAYYWWPKITGRLLDERLGRLQFWLLFIGFNLTFFPPHYLGAIG